MMRHISVSGVLLWVVTAAIAVFLILPTVIVIPISFTTLQTLSFPPVGFTLHWYREVFENPEWRCALVNSLTVAVLATVLAAVLGTAAALGISRLSSFARSVSLPILLAPLVTPVVVLSIGIYMTFTRLGLSNTLTGLALAHAALGIPFVIVSVLASLMSLNRNLELASAGLGATRFFTIRRVVLPLIMPGVVSGSIFACLTSWDEVVVALFLTGGDTRTIPVLIWSQVRADLYPSMAAVGTLLIVISAILLLISQKFVPLGSVR
jgi:putative spermidine/putrescine transport system permease protein